jgi:hypothetical protein
MSEFAQRRLVTIIAEPVVEERLLRDLQAWGVGGFNVGRSEGDPFGSRVADVEGAFVRIECVVSEATADRVLTELARVYLKRFKVVAYDHPVRVVRGEKYT